MSIYNVEGMQISETCNVNGDWFPNVYDIYGVSRVESVSFDDLVIARTLSVALDETNTAQKYMGGYIEIQPDSWDGSVPSTDAYSNCWGFPMSLTIKNQSIIKDEMLRGNGKGIMYIRFPLGFAYRGYRNIDEYTGLARNIGERWSGQNMALKNWFYAISSAGGGLAPEYWCPPVYWLTGGAYNATNYLWAGGIYDRNVKLSSIKNSDAEQYTAQIEAFTDAVIDDLEYLHQNIAPVRMFGLQNEPDYATQPYGACGWDAQTYNDVLEVLYPKILASDILTSYNGEPNTVLLHVASDDSGYFTSQAATFISNHADMIWGYSYHAMRQASGESSGVSIGADWYKSSEFQSVKGTKENVFINEYEYFDTSFGTDDFRCGNNMLRLINELVYGGSKVLHPIIHICKPAGQILPSTNMRGYCLYAVDLDDGSYTTNAWAYNSWKMFNDNLPVGAVVVGDYSKTVDNAGFVVLKHSGKLYVFMANNSDTNVSITITFDESKIFGGKAYSMQYLGAWLGNKVGSEITFIVPAYTGVCWKEQ